MRKTLLLTGSLALGCIAAIAAPLDPQSALAAALQQGPAKVHSANPQSDYTLVYTAPQQGAYLFSRSGGGFVLASGDSDKPALLGYSDSAVVDPANLPPAFLDLTEAFAHGRFFSSRAAADRTEILPMLTTKWNQDAPFNDDCPSGTVTGCVATATAQVMKYYEWPQAGTGLVSTEYKGQTLSMNLPDHPFEWDLMQDTYYQDTYTPDQAAAVANLMYCIGCSVQMEYGPASGANMYRTIYAIVNNFDYDKGIQLLAPDYFPHEQWVQLIYDELAASRPVLYSGVGSEGGHAFIADGYRYEKERDYFHINWGWGGMSDGYFLLNALEPMSLGAGGGAGAFNYSQTAYIGMQKPLADSHYVPVLAASSNMTPEKLSYTRDELVFIAPEGGYYDGIFNYTPAEGITVRAGVKLTDTQSGEVTYVTGYYGEGELPFLNGLRGVMVDADNMPTNGTYTVTPAITYDGNWYDIYTVYAEQQPVTMECTASDVTFTLGEAPGYEDLEHPGELQLLGYDFPELIVLDEDTHISAEFHAEGGFVDPMTICPGVISGRQLLSLMEEQTLELEAGESKTLTWDGRFIYPMEEGEYQLAMLLAMDGGYSLLWSEPVRVIADTSAGTGTLDLRGPKVEPNPIVAGETSTVTAVFKAKDGSVLGNYFPALTRDSEILSRLESREIVLTAGENERVIWESIFPDTADLTPGAYMLGIYRESEDGPVLISETEVELTSSSAISGIESDDTPAEYFTPQGLRVTTPQPGSLYIVRTPGCPAAKRVIR